MKLVTYNIRCDCGADGANNFCFRKPLILKKLEQEKPDIICFQEVMSHVADWLRQNLNDYVVVGCGRGKELGDEQMTVAFLKEKFNLMKMDTYWMSETPFVPGSRYPEQSNCPRTCTELVLQERESKQVFRLIDTHLDHVGALVRTLGLKQILKKLEGEQFFPEIPVIITGDFNATPEDDEMKVIAEYPGFTDVTAGIGTTWHDYMRRPDFPQIDYIFVKGGISCEKVEKWTDEENGVYLSDHFPVCAILHFE